MASTRDLDNSISLPVGGMDERAVPEGIAPEDFYYLRGWIQDQIGNLRKIPGKSFLQPPTLNLRGQPILSITAFGDYVIVQTYYQLLKFSNAELFGGIDYTVDTNPDIYPVTSAEEENMSQIILKYKTAVNVAGAVVLANNWNKVPFSDEVRDTGGNCVLNAGGSFTLSAGAYPKNVRIKAWCNVASPDSNVVGAAAAMLAQLKLKTTPGVFIDSGMGVKVITEQNNKTNKRTMGQAFLDTFFVLAAATEYQLELFTDDNSIFGEAINTTSTEEKYALAEILIE